MIRLNVRCCCVPVKVLGTLPVFEKDARAGALVRFPVMQPRVHVPTPEDLARPMRNPPQIEFFVSRYAEIERVSWSEASLFLRERVTHSELALKHDGITIETLRRIPGFIEASHG